MAQKKTESGSRVQTDIVVPGLCLERRTSPYLFLAVASLMLLSVFYNGCGFVPFYATGKRFDVNRATEIVDHQTTRGEILEMFGMPLQTNLGDTHQASWWRYEYTHNGFVDVEQASLEIYFNDDLVDTYFLRVDRRRY
jgi:hypothetical protein